MHIRITSPVARLGLCALIKAHQTWYEALEISDDAKSDINFWFREFKNLMPKIYGWGPQP